MRAIHLLGLRGADGARLRFYPDDDAPLVLPWWIPERDREVLLAFYQQVIADDLLVRVEVEWVDGVPPHDLAFLASERRRHGAEDRMVVVRVRREGVDLHDVLGLPEIRAFRRVAVVCEHMAEHETVGMLLRLGRVATLAAEERYGQLAEELTLRDDGPLLLASIHQELLNPVVAIECFNRLVNVQIEGVAFESQRDEVVTRTLRQLLSGLSGGELSVLTTVAILRQAAPAMSPAVSALRSRMILRNSNLAGWATWLREAFFINELTAHVDARRAKLLGIAEQCDLALAADALLRWGVPATVTSARPAITLSLLKPPP